MNESIVVVIGAITPLLVAIAALIKAWRAPQNALDKLHRQLLTVDRNDPVFPHGIFAKCFGEILDVADDRDFILEKLLIALHHKKNSFAKLLTSRDDHYPHGVLSQCMDDVLLSDSEASKRIAELIIILSTQMNKTLSQPTEIGHIVQSPQAVNALMDDVRSLH